MKKPAFFRGFSGKSAPPIEMFGAPYLCSSCKRRVQVPVAVSAIDLKADSISLPEIRCEACGEVMEFDEIPQTYFQFLHDSK